MKITREVVMPKTICAVLISMCLLTAACVQRVLESAPADPVPPGVPEPYRAIYREIDSEIDRQLPLVPLPWGQKKTDTAFGVELLTANSNRGEALLDEHVLQENALMLDRLKSLGVQCVSLSLHYPVLTRNYPRIAEFREFYRARRRFEARLQPVVAEMGSAREPS
jgi:hypothetical protein